MWCYLSCHVYVSYEDLSEVALPCMFNRIRVPIGLQTLHGLVYTYVDQASSFELAGLVTWNVATFHVMYVQIWYDEDGCLWMMGCAAIFFRMKYFSVFGPFKAKIQGSLNGGMINISM